MKYKYIKWLEEILISDISSVQQEIDPILVTPDAVLNTINRVLDGKKSLQNERY